ncbi:hypothetical protein ACFX5U_08340 [Sphingobacterium sp. SG20118]|uniref:hypothetical protein n=1 Tax=Sphingobacterium sp. SG20118 TaxID=3367156 RepID=UPI0037DFC807
MKYWFLLPLLLITVNLPAQVKYFIIQDQTDDYSLNHYKLSTEQLYGVKKKVELFCMTFPGLETIKKTQKQYADINLDIVLLSVLPDLSGNSDWIEIDMDSIKNNIITHWDLKRLFSLNTFSEFDQKYGAETKYFNEYQVIKKTDNKYYASRHCLLQFFAVRKRPSVFQNVFGTINIEQEPLSIIEMERIFKKRYSDLIFPPYSMAESLYSSSNSFDFLRDRREYLSKVIKLRNKELAYQFWTYTGWRGQDFEYKIDRGIDRFVYLPGKGIIGGSFDFYFYYHRKKLPIEYKDFMQNIKEEKVMIADIYK